jgi:hypothetical protein
MSAWNPFFALRAVDFFGVDGDSGLPIDFEDTYLEEVLAGDSVLQSPERFGRVLSPIEQRRLCDRQVFTPRPFRSGFVFGLLCGGSQEPSEIVILARLCGASQTDS